MASRHPSKKEIETLLAALGRYIGAGRGRGVGVRIEQRLFDRYRSVLDKLIHKYPDVDFESETAQEQLRKRAEAWWDSRGFRGAGIDW